MLYRYWIRLLEVLLFRVYRINRPDRKKARIYDAFYPVYDASVLGETIRLYCPNLKVFKRCDSFLRKEPETIEWIASFPAGAALFDIGANIGLYSLLAAQKGARVVAFEPESQNFAVMNANVHLNALADRIATLNAALSDRHALDYLYMPVFSVGTAFNQFGAPDGERAERPPAGFRQAVFAYTLDEFIERYSAFVPTHIKIDVDGIEARILAGASRTLANPAVQSLLVELDRNRAEDREAMNGLLSKGFQVASQTTKGDETGVCNFIFRR
jgi:FkbM family methyltransferase